jgi:hypothetical protein
MDWTLGLRDGGTESEISVEQVKNALRTSGHSIKAVVPRTNRCGNVDPSFVCTASHLERYARLASPMGGRGVWEQSDQHFSPEGTALRCGGICQRRHTRKAKHQPLTTTTTRHRSDPRGAGLQSVPPLHDPDLGGDGRQQRAVQPIREAVRAASEQPLAGGSGDRDALYRRARQSAQSVRVFGESAGKCDNRYTATYRGFDSYY